MILLNFGHPITDSQLAAIQTATDQKEWEIQNVKTQFDHERPFPEQVSELIGTLKIDPQTWQTVPILINPPTLNIIALSVMAELHGRMGYFPAIIRLRPVPGSLPPQFEFAEIINLQAMRDQARTQR